MDQTQIHKERQVDKPAPEESAPVEAKNLENKPLAKDVEELLGEIDEVLEENAQEFVAAFVQKGGQ